MLVKPAGLITKTNLFAESPLIMIRKTHPLTAGHFKVIGEFTLGPHEEAQFFVGIYENVIPQPLLLIEYKPNNEGHILASLVRIDNEGDYSLTYHLENTSGLTFAVTVAACWSDEP